MNPSDGETDVRMATHNRSQSETLGFVLVFAIMIVGALIVVGLGANAITDTEERLGDSRAEKSMTQFDSKAGLVALGEADSQRVNFATDEGEFYRVREDSGWMNVTFTNQSNGNTEVVMNETLGAVTYETDQTNMAYQGGGVWRKTETGGQMVSPPEFHFRNGTLTLPAITVTGDLELGDRADITQGTVEQKFPISSNASRTNPLDNHLVNVSVGSEYYQGWGEYFEERTDGKVEYDHDREVVTLLLLSPLEMQTVTSASTSLTPAGEFRTTGSPSSSCGNIKVYSDSYNSTGTTNDYCTQEGNGNTGNEGDIIYGDDIDISSGTGGGDFYGEVKSGGTVTVSGSMGGGPPSVEGNISYTDSCNPSVSDCDSRSTGDVRRISGIDVISTIDFHVESTIKQTRNENDNSSAPISGGTLDFSSPTDTVTLSAGSYYLDRIDLEPGQTLELDTSGGSITLAVDERVVLQGSGSDGGTIDVVGGKPAQLYVGGNGISDPHLEMEKSTEIITSNDNATRFRTYGKQDFQATIGDGSNNLAKYVGIIYAPTGNTGSGRVDIDGGELFGGLLTGTTTLGRGSIHYDEALREEQAISRSASIVKVTYLHVTVNQIVVKS